MFEVWNGSELILWGKKGAITGMCKVPVAFQCLELKRAFDRMNFRINNDKVKLLVDRNDQRAIIEKVRTNWEGMEE